jgi:hypothetical protein
MTSVMFMLMMQFVVSTKAGLVNFVQGDVNVKATQSVQAGVPIKVGPAGFAEILLNPGSYLRLGENSEAVLEGIELTDISLRLVSGTAVVEAVGFDKERPLKVANGNLVMEIIKDGVYRFSDGTVSVVQGRIRAAGTNTVFSKGWQVSKDETYQKVKAPKGTSTVLETWSRDRSKLIAAANINIARTLRRSQDTTFGLLDTWMWVPGFGAYVFMPGYQFRSPYGYNYRSFTDIYYGGNSVEAANSGYGANRGGSSNGGGGFSGSAGGAGAGESRPPQGSIGGGNPSPGRARPEQ